MILLRAKPSDDVTLITPMLRGTINQRQQNVFNDGGGVRGGGELGTHPHHPPSPHLLRQCQAQLLSAVAFIAFKVSKNCACVSEFVSHSAIYDTCILPNPLMYGPNDQSRDHAIVGQFIMSETKSVFMHRPTS